IAAPAGTVCSKADMIGGPNLKTFADFYDKSERTCIVRSHWPQSHIGAVRIAVPSTDVRTVWLARSARLIEPGPLQYWNLCRGHQRSSEPANDLQHKRRRHAISGRETPASREASRTWPFN